DKVIITIKEARALVERSYFAPSAGRYRVIVVEDADRMVERTSNVLLKALEEPPEQTVWVLCAPSEADLLPTIRSRVRALRLREPDVADVARLITLRTGADEAVAEQAARHAQRHIGMAQRLATDEDARRRRDETLRAVLSVRGVGTAVEVAGHIIQAATDDAKALTALRPGRGPAQARHAQASRRDRAPAHRPRIDIPRRGHADLRSHGPADQHRAPRRSGCARRRVARRARVHRPRRDRGHPGVAG